MKETVKNARLDVLFSLKMKINHFSGTIEKWKSIISGRDEGSI